MLSSPFGIARCLFFPVAAALLCAVAAPAQEAAGTGVVEGRILNPVTGDYVNNALVTIEGTNREAFTDSSGFYRFSGLPAGLVKLKVSYADFDVREVTVELTAGEVVVQDFNLTNQERYGKVDEDGVLLLDPYVVAATRETDGAVIAINEQRAATNIKNVVAADEFGDVAEGNVGEFIKLLPGVTVEYGAGDASGMTLRGLPPEFTPVTIDNMDIASASGGRGFSFEQLSINNAARVEVTKTPIPSMPANAIGGSLNLVSKRAFDRSRPQLTYRGFFTFTDEDYSLGKTPGPGTRETAKARPGVEFTYIAPVTKTFGYTVTGMYSDQFGRERFSVPTWEYLAASGGSEANPYLRGYQLRDDPRQTKRTSLGLGADWRPFDPLTLTFNYQFNSYDMETNVNRLVFNTGTLAPSFGADYTTGRLNAGTVQHNPLWTNKYGDTHLASLKGRYSQGPWRVDFSAAFSKATTDYDDLDAGYFRTANIQIARPTVNYAGITDVRPTEITVNSAGQVVDWTQVANYRIVNAQSLPSRNLAENTTANLDLRRELMLGDNPAALQIGASFRRLMRDRVQESFLYNYVGADGVALSADDGAAGLLDDIYINRDPGHGWPADIQWASMMKLADLYRSNPGYFRLNEVNNVQERASNSEWFQESILAAYLQGELKLLRNRLSLVGGVRWERTQNEGLGLLLNRDATHADPVEQARLRYIERGAYAENTYDGYFASGNATYAITKDLLLRVGISETIGRPDLVNIIPNFDVDTDAGAAPGQPGGAVRMRNPSLKPWTAINYDVALEYYMGRSGMISLGAFRKDISNAFGTMTYVVDADLMDQLNLGPEYLGWEVTTKFNVNDASITGTEFSYRQRLTMLPGWANGFTIFANGAVLDLEGDRVDFTGFVEKSAAWGVSYSKKRLGFRLNWNYRGKQFINNQSFAPDAIAYVLPRLTLDTNLEYRFGRGLSVFFNARNLTKDVIDRVKTSSNAPDYASLYQRNIYSVKFTAGIRGTF